MSEPQTKRQKPNYYMRRKRYFLQPGLKGFLCTCNFREKECVQEAYNILNLYADQLKLSTTADTEDKHVSSPTEETSVEIKAEDSDSDDIADELSKEINAARNEGDRKRFQVVDSGAKNVVFIRTTVDNPTKLVSAIINDILLTKQQKTRYLLRIIPIQNICKANMEDIIKTVSKLVDIHFTEPKTFAIVFNHRNNQKLTRTDINSNIADVITSKDSKNKVELKNPELTVIVEVIKGLCLLSIIPDYYKFKKYNLLQIAESVKESEPVDQSKENTDTADTTEISENK